jgi:phytoene synthase
VDAVQHCDALVRERDEDRWLAAHYAPKAARERLIALYAAFLEIERVPSQVREGPLGDIRLQWWRDGLAGAAGGKPPPHPVLQALAEVQIGESAMRALGAAIDAQAPRVWREPLKTVEEVRASLAHEAGLVRAACEMLAPDAAYDAASVERAGAAFALARNGPRVAEPLYRDICASVEASAATRRGVFPSAIMPAIAHFALTRAYIGGAAPGGLTKRARIFLAVASGRI